MLSFSFCISDFGMSEQTNMFVSLPKTDFLYARKENMFVSLPKTDFLYACKENSQVLFYCCNVVKPFILEDKCSLKNNNKCKRHVCVCIYICVCVRCVLQRNMFLG